MAKYRAVQGFTGITTMKAGEVRDFDNNEQWVKDLINYGFIEAVQQPKKAAAEEVEEPEKAPKKKSAKKSTK